MSNFWIKTTQKIQESFLGPRTKDQDFDQIQNSVKEYEKTLNSTRNILHNFGKLAKNLKDFCKEVCEMVNLIYDKDSHYYNLGSEICENHSFIEKSYNELLKDIQDICLSTNEWNHICDPAKQFIKKREESRQLYDYYQKKISDLNKSKEEQIFKNGKIKENLIEKILRNEEKYQKASDDYIRCSYEAYYGIGSILEKKHETFNPVIIKFIKGEMKFFQNISNTFQKMENIESRIYQVSRKSLKQLPDYNPIRYTSKSFFNESPDSKTTSFIDNVKTTNNSSSNSSKNLESVNFFNPDFDLVTLTDFDLIQNEFSIKNIEEKDLSKKTLVMNNYKRNEKEILNKNNIIESVQKCEVQNTIIGSQIKIEDKLKIFEKKNEEGVKKNQNSHLDKIKFFEKKSESIPSKTTDDLKNSGGVGLLNSKVSGNNGKESNLRTLETREIGHSMKIKPPNLLNEKVVSNLPAKTGKQPIDKFEKFFK